MARGDYRTYYISAIGSETRYGSSYTPSGARKELVTAVAGQIQVASGTFNSNNKNGGSLVGLLLDSSITLQAGSSTRAFVTTVEV